MPFDVRRISFHQDEVIQAILELSRANVQRLPPGKIVGIVLGAPDVTATLAIRRNTSAPTVRVIVPSTAVAAALILYCVNRKIPLPAQAAKSLEWDRDGVCLVAEREIKPKRLQPHEYGSYVPEEEFPSAPPWARPLLSWKS
jgi:hypothetical protein